MLLTLRFRVKGDASPETPDSALVAVLEGLASKPGYQRGWIGRSPDEPSVLLLAAEFDSIGSGRRAISAADLRALLWPLMPSALDDVSAFEVLAMCAPGGAADSLVSGLAADAGTYRLGQDAANAAEPAAGH